ncbi:hypothetical protein [Micromonospora sp. NPDC126480]|uniref:hypothetical protein n=1 Tax=Micromonospora sp. NPDC126480 TaxID=3155312 RepID=UPI0033331988
MYVVLAWFGERLISPEARLAARDRVEAALATVAPKSYVRHEVGGDDWGVTVLHVADQAPYRWPTVATDGPVTAVSLGIPVGVDPAGGPAALARRLLAGEDIQRTVVPPFGLLALDADRRFAVQQDWLGMCRLFTGAADGLTVLSSRPSLVAAFLHGRAEPDLDGWRSYTVCSHFGAELSPVHGARLLRAGERLTGQRRDGGGWSINAEVRYGVDDVVMAGFDAQGRTAEALDLAAEAITHTTSSFHDLYDAEVDLGLSGGKDSRLIAASLVAAGRLPRFFTNRDIQAEADVATELLRLLRDKRGLAPSHDLRLKSVPAQVVKIGVQERVRRMQHRFDFQYPSTYLPRQAVAEWLPDAISPATFSGAGGELAVGYWYPPAGQDRTPEESAAANLLSAIPARAFGEGVLDAERARITGILDHAKGIGVHDLHLADYLYLVERVRRWYSSAYTVGMVTPFLTPGFVTATFALTPQQKYDRLVHTGLIERLVPEWSGVPFATAYSRESTAAKVWQGDGIEAIAELVDTAHGPITQLIRRDEVVRALTRAARDQATQADERTLQHFACLAMASHELEPATVRPATSATYRRVTAPPKAPTVRSKLVSRTQWIKKSRLGRRLWNVARRQVRARRPG